MTIDPKMKRRLKRMLGKKCVRQNRVAITFDLYTQRSFPHWPDQDEVLLIDLLDQISRHCMDFHDIPGFKLQKVTVDGKTIL